MPLLNFQKSFDELPVPISSREQMATAVLFKNYVEEKLLETVDLPDNMVNVSRLIGDADIAGGMYELTFSRNDNRPTRQWQLKITRAASEGPYAASAYRLGKDGWVRREDISAVPGDIVPTTGVSERGNSADNAAILYIETHEGWNNQPVCAKEIGRLIGGINTSQPIT